MPDKKLIQDTVSNLIGVVLPAVAALFCIPPLIMHLGAEAFGIFSLQMAILFFLGISDFGISKAIVFLSFDRRFSSDKLWLKPFLTGAYYSVALVLILLVVAAVMWALTYSSAYTNHNETLRSTAIIIVSSAAMLLTLPYRAIFEVEKQFFKLNLIKGPAAASLFAAPLAGFQFQVSLESAAWAILFTRIGFLLAYILLSSARFEDIHHAFTLKKGLSISSEQRKIFVRKAIAFGITNFGSLLITYMDRFIIVLFVSAAAVGHFVIAQELVSKLWLVIGAAIIASVPRIAAENEAKKPEQMISGVRSLKLLIVTGGFLPAVLLILMGEQVLQFWLQSAYSSASTLPLQIMAIGIAVNSLSQVNFLLLQIMGGEERGAALQVANLVFATLALLLLIPGYSIVGAACAFTLRMILDAFVVRHLLVIQDIRGQTLGFGHGALAVSSVFTIFLLAGVSIL
jgi:O-antigen/teichoic acid export membrane protein